MIKRNLTILSAVLLITLVSCSGGKEEAEPKADVGEPMPTKEIINRYVTTVTTAKGKAEDVAGSLEERAASQHRAIGHVDDQHTDRP